MTEREQRLASVEDRLRRVERRERVRAYIATTQGRFRAAQDHMDVARSFGALAQTAWNLRVEAGVARWRADLPPCRDHGAACPNYATLALVE